MNDRSRKALLLLGTLLMTALLWGCAPPQVKLKVSRNEVKKGDPVTVSWESKNAKNVELNGQQVEKIGAKTFTPEQDTRYEVVGKRGKKTASASESVKVTVVTAAPTMNLRAEPSAVERGQKATLRWSTENAKVVTIEGLGEVAASGEREVQPAVSTTYSGRALGDGGTATASARVTVTDPPAAATAERPRTTRTGPTSAELFATNVAANAVFFELDSATLAPSEQEKLRRVAEWLLQDPHRTVTFRIEGNCDPRGTAEYNLGLGDRRARAAKSFLTSLGVDASRIDTISYGLEKAQGTSEGAPHIIPSWAHDRRDDFVYVGGGVQP
jgi:peptidoglycan-associated lipoprotein